jgi:hypothetical protein
MSAFVLEELKRGAACYAGSRSKCFASPERARPRVTMADRAPAGCEFVRSKWLLSHADSRFWDCGFAADNFRGLGHAPAGLRRRVFVWAGKLNPDATVLSPDHAARIDFLLRYDDQCELVRDADLRSDVERCPRFRQIANNTTYRHIADPDQTGV